MLAPETLPASEEVLANFQLERKALGKDKFLSERMQIRLARRLRKSAGLAAPTVTTGLLDDEEINEITAFANAVREACSADEPAELSDAEAEASGDDEEEAPEPGSDAWLAEQMRLTAALDPSNYGGDSDDDDSTEAGDEADGPAQAWLVQCSAEHEKLYLHRGVVLRGSGGEGGGAGARRRTNFARSCPALLAKLLDHMRTQAHAGGLCDAAEVLHIRCVEIHQYTAGGGLSDPGHCDVGSKITLSVALSHPTSGGRFSTTDSFGRVTEYELARGDAILFCSEMVHNVSTVQAGTRNSLVIELWTDKANRVDRYH